MKGWISWTLPVIANAPCRAVAFGIASSLTSFGTGIAQENGSGYPFEVSVREIWRTYGDPGFSTIRGMVQWPDGSVWVGDNRLAEVHEVSPDGSVVRLALREGDGPREVRRVRYLAAVPGGGVFVQSGERIQFFNSDRQPTRVVTERASVWAWGVAASSDGGYLLSGGFGTDPRSEAAPYAIHRFDSEGRRTRSWHPAVDHVDWETVRSTSGGPIAMTADGGLLVVDTAPFRITRYADLEGNGGKLVVEDHGVVSPAELERAVVHGSNNSRSYTTAWTRSVHISEMSEGGNIISVVRVVPQEEGVRRSSLWVVVSPNGEILARTAAAFDYTVWNATPDGHYLASLWDNDRLEPAAVKLEVTLSPAK